MKSKWAKTKEGWVRYARDLNGKSIHIGRVLGENIYLKQWWTPILWDDEEDPGFFKTGGLEFFNSQSEAEHEC